MNNEIESALIDLVRKLIRAKKFVRNVLWSEECLQREVKKGADSQMQYYVLVLEASLAFSSAMTIPLMSDF